MTQDQERVDRQRVCESVRRGQRRAGLAARHELHALVRQLPRGDLAGPAGSAELHAAHEDRIGGRDDALADVVLDGEELARLEVVAVRPERVTGLGVVDAYEQAPARFAKAQRAIDQEAGAESAADRLGGAEGPSRVAGGGRDDGEPAPAREQARKVVGHREPGRARARVVIEGDEGQDGDGRSRQDLVDGLGACRRAQEERHRLGAVRDVERLHQGGHVGLDGRGRDAEHAGDVVVGQALGEELQDLALARREAVYL